MASLARAGDWPTYRADAARSGTTAEPLPQQLDLQWSYRAKHKPRPAWPTSDRIHFDFAYQPIVVGRTVIFGTSTNDKVVALDLSTGTQRWAFFTEGPVRFAPAAWRDRLFVASDDGWLYAISIAEGKLLWKHRGGPNDRRLLGNDRMISRWPARGGPVVIENQVFYAAGMWPTEGVYLHALDAASGKVVWTNDSTGTLTMPQPHGGSSARSGMTPQGYLLANDQQVFVPTGRAVPAVFRRSDGELLYYHLQKNHSIGGARAMLADRFLCNGGCLFDQQTGLLAARCGRGLLSATPDGLLQSTHTTLIGYRWKDLEGRTRKGKPVRYYGLEKYCEVELEKQQQPEVLAEVFRRYPSLKDLYEPHVRFKEVFGSILNQNNLEVELAQRRPELQELGLRIEPFLATTYEKTGEVIVAGSEAICGARGALRVVDLAKQTVRWSHRVEGTVLGLAASQGHLIASTDEGMIYAFGPRVGEPAARKESDSDDRNPENPSGAIDYEAAAAEILKTGVTDGFCVDLGCEAGDLALALARKSRLQIACIEPDSQKVLRARRKLDAAGLYGGRVAVAHGDPSDAPYTKHCANLVVSSRALSGDAAEPAAVRRIQRPLSGVVCLGRPGHMQIRRRGPLEGAEDWTHQNANPANTLCSGDRLAKGPLESLWFRDVDFEITDRHAQGPAPLVSQGCLVVEGVNGLCGLDAYNGRTLWIYPMNGILKDCDGSHHDVAVGDTGSNFCLSDDSVYVASGPRCLRLDLKTGKLLAEFATPAANGDKNRNWGYLATIGGMLYGSVVNEEHTVSPRYRDIRLRTESVLFFAMDAKTGEVKWRYEPKQSIRNNAIAIARDRVYLVDRPLAMADRITEPKRYGKHRPSLKPGQHPGGVLLALDAANGKIVWQQTDDVFGTQLAVSQQHGVLLMYYQALRYDFFQLPSEIGGRMAAFETATGMRIWDRKVVHKTRPVINDTVIYAYGGAWNLKTGEEIPFKLERTHGCGQISASANLMLFRSATLGYLDLTRNEGTENFGGMRLGCWINAIPAAGLVLVPDGSAKCQCSYQNHAWLALQERE